MKNILLKINQLNVKNVLINKFNIMIILNVLIKFNFAKKIILLVGILKINVIKIVIVRFIVKNVSSTIFQQMNKKNVKKEINKIV